MIERHRAETMPAAGPAGWRTRLKQVRSQVATLAVALLIVFPFISAASAQIAFVQNIGTNTKNIAGNASITLTIPLAGVALGHSVIVTLRVGSLAGGIACSDSQSNSYNPDLTSAAGSGRIAVVSAHNVTALVSGDVITCTYPGFSGISLISANEFSGLSGTPLDQSAQNGSSNAGAVSSGLTATTTQADELIFGLFQLGAALQTITPATTGSNPAETYNSPPNSSPYTKVGVVSTMNPMYRVVSTTRQYEANGTVAGSGFWKAAVVTYKGAAANVVLTVAKSFTASSINAGGSSLLTITLTNANPGAVTGAAFTDTYPANVVNTAAPAGATTCAGGTVTAASNGPSVALSGGTVPASGSCTVTVNVTSNVAGAYVNHTGPVTTTNAGTASEATATLTVNNVAVVLTVAKSFASGTINPGGSLLLTITLTNPNLVAMTGVAFTDTYPANMVNTAAPAGATTCGGVLTAASNGGSVALSGGTVPASGSCTVTVNVTSNVPGVYVNHTGPVTTNAGTAPEGTATLTVNNVAPTSSVPIPTLSGWMLILISGLLALFGLAVLRRSPR